MRNGLVLAWIISVLPLAASAQLNNRSFVSTTGNDANSCTAGSECRSFTRAIAMTNTGGEVLAITSGGYGAFQLHSAMTVMAAPGVAAGITSNSTDGIYVSAGAMDDVVIRGINVTVLSGIVSGIAGISFRNLSVDNCTMYGGLEGATVSTGVHATFTDSVVRGASYGFVSGTRATLLRCRAEGNNVGLYATNGSTTDGIITAVDFTAANNAGAGVEAVNSTAGHTVSIDLMRAVISHNGIGVYAMNSPAPAMIRIAYSVVTTNTGIGLDQAGSGVIASMGNNLVAGNAGGDIGGTISGVTLH